MFVKERASMIRRYVKNPPQTVTALKRLTAAIAGHKWIDQATCHEHQTPFDMIRTVYFDVRPDVFCEGSRSGWKTRSVGMLNVLEAITKPGIDIAHAGAVKSQGDKAQWWTRWYLINPAVEEAGLLRNAIMPKTKPYILDNGSTIEIITATVENVNGPKKNRFRLDEYELVKEEVIGEVQNVVSSYNGIKRNILRITSRKFPDGPVARLKRDPVKMRRWAIISYCWLDVSEPCPDWRSGTKPAIMEVDDIEDPDGDYIVIEAYEKCRECPLVATCKGMAKESKGYVPIDDSIAEFEGMTLSGWIAQKMTLKPPPEHKHPFRKFGEKRNVREFEFNPAIPLKIVLDFSGGEANFAALFWQEDPPGFAKVHDELIISSVGKPLTIEEVEILEKKVSRDYPNVEHIEARCDSANPKARRDWNQLLTMFQLEPVKKLRTKKDMVEKFQALISPPGGGTRYWVNPRCTTHISQMRTFARSKLKGSRGRSGFLDKDDDTVDCGLYIALQIDIQTLKPGVSVINTDGGRIGSSREDDDPDDIVQEENGMLVVNEKKYVEAVMGRMLRRMRRR